MARARAEALEELYQAREQGGTTSGSQAQVLVRATSATSDRRNTFAMFGLLGLVAGVALGTGLALLRTQTEVRRLTLR